MTVFPAHAGIITRVEERRGLADRTGKIKTKHPTRPEKEQPSNTICPTRQKQDYIRPIIDNTEIACMSDEQLIDIIGTILRFKRRSI